MLHKLLNETVCPPHLFFFMPQLNNRLFDELNVRNLVSSRWHSQTTEQVSVDCMY